MFAKTFRNTLIASTLVIAGAALATPANAAMDDVVPLSGAVLSTTAIDATATPAASTLVLGGEGTATADVMVKVADLAILSNNTEGVTVTATGAGSLGNGDTTDVVPYQVRMATATQVLTASDFAALSVNESIARAASGEVGLVDGETTRQLFIKYDAPSMLNVGTYTSSIEVTIADNN